MVKIQCLGTEKERGREKDREREGETKREREREREVKKTLKILIIYEVSIEVEAPLVSCFAMVTRITGLMRTMNAVPINSVPTPVFRYRVASLR